jgi:hypothetical protein
VVQSTAYRRREGHIVRITRSYASTRLDLCRLARGRERSVSVELPCFRKARVRRKIDLCATTKAISQSSILMPATRSLDSPRGTIAHPSNLVSKPGRRRLGHDCRDKATIQQSLSSLIPQHGKKVLHHVQLLKYHHCGECLPVSLKHIARPFVGHIRRVSVKVARSVRKTFLSNGHLRESIPSL